MKIAIINTVNIGSTGNIALSISKSADQNGHESYFCCPKSRTNMRRQVDNQIFIGNRFVNNVSLLLSKFTGLQGCFSFFSTLMFLKRLKKKGVTMIHLHNLHNNYINLPLLFRFIKKNNIPTIWTLHDCWAFTGHCPHFTAEKCDRWKNGCQKCNYPLKSYPAVCINRSRKMWRLKKKWFTGVKNMRIVTPSQWLSDLVKQSFLKEYPVYVINNGIDLNVFKPRDNTFRKDHSISDDSYLILGVAFDWGYKKGIDVFIELSKRLPKNYKIVLVGTDDTTAKDLPDNIITINRTNNQYELAKIYSAADLFVNPTREENYPTVNMESLACGTPVLTFRTGGSPEIIDKTCGSVVECDDIDSLEKEARRICETKCYSKEACLDRSLAFDEQMKFKEYLSFY